MHFKEIQKNLCQKRKNCLTNGKTFYANKEKNQQKNIRYLYWEFIQNSLKKMFVSEIFTFSKDFLNIWTNLQKGRN